MSTVVYCGQQTEQMSFAALLEARSGMLWARRQAARELGEATARAYDTDIAEVDGELRERSRRATERARAVLRPGDRICFTVCCEQRRHVVMTGWDGDWIASATKNDIHASSIYKVNGKPTSFLGDPVA